MKKLGIAVAATVLTAAGAVAYADGFKNITESLLGYEEVPAVSTNGNGEFRARISNNQSEITYRLSYADMEATVTQAHIHFGQFGVNGGIVVFLCTNLGNGPAGTQPCPPSPATITGTIDAGDVVASAAAQGIATGEFAELIRAMRAGVTYVNVHSTTWPGGEIRSQIDTHDGHGHDD